MAEGIQLLEGESFIAELVSPDEFIKHRNQVAYLTNQRLIFLKKKTLGAYYTIEYIPLSLCTEISYKKTLAIGSMIGGAFLAALGLLVLFFTFTGELHSFGAAFYGVPLIGLGGALVFGVKRHSILFHCSGRTLKWISSPGGFKKRLTLLREIRDYAFQRGILVTEFVV